MPQLSDLEYRSPNDYDYDGIEKTLKCIAAKILDNGYLTGNAFSGTDIQMSCVLELVRMGKLPDADPSLENTRRALSSVRPTSARADVAILYIYRKANFNQTDLGAALAPIEYPIAN